MSSYDELTQIANALREQTNLEGKLNVLKPIDKLSKAIDQMNKAFSGSWLGYHSNVYYRDFTPPPPGTHFSSEWGLKELISSLGTKGDWVEYDPEEITQKTYEIAENPSLEELNKIAKDAKVLFETSKSDILSILTSEISIKHDTFLETVKAEVNDLESLSRGEILQRIKPNGETITRDPIAADQGVKAPPHLIIKAEIIKLNNAIGVLTELEITALKAAKHIHRQNKSKKDSISEPSDECGEFKFLLHPLIVTHAYSLYENGNYREAVLNSITAIYDFIRERTGTEEDGDRLVGHVFALENPLLILSELETDSGKNDQKGFMQIFKGVYQGVRNPKAHTLTHNLNAIKAAQYLVFASLLIRRVEESVVVPQS